MIRQEANFESIEKRTRWVLWFRMAFLCLIAFSAWILESFYSEKVASELWAVLAGGVGLTIISFFLSYRFKEAREQNLLAWAQLIIDLPLTLFFVARTGGTQSAFVLLFGLHMMTMGILLLSRGALVSTFASCIAFVAYGLLEYESSGVSGVEVFHLLLVSSALLLVGGLVTLLFRHRESLIKTLYRTSRNLEDLHLIHSAMIEHMPSGVLLTDEPGEIIYSNPSADRILGIHGKWDHLKGSPLEATLESEHSEIQIERDGQTAHLICEMVNLPLGRRLILLTDISRLRRLEESLRLKEKLASVGQLAAGLAHEIKNPLASLSGSIQLLRKDLPTDSAEGKLMNIVLRETDRLDELLKNFLNYAKPSTLRLTRVNFKKVVEEIILLFMNSELVQESSVQIENRISDDALAMADEAKMKQVLWNLLKNASHVSRPGGRVELKSELRRGQLKIEIVDEGPGIPKEEISRIFEPFYTQRPQGAGLGLAVVYQNVTAHEGSVGVESQLDKGSRFWFELPVNGPAKKDSAAQAA